MLGAKAYALRLGSPTSPGPGFFPFWLSSALAVVALAMLVFERGRAALGRPHTLGAVLLVTAAVNAYGLLLEPLGFAVTSFLFLLFLWAVVERQPIVRGAALAALSTATAWALFDVVLRVRFPRGVLGF